jgi:ribose transport system substrate-binding protein
MAACVAILGLMAAGCGGDGGEHTPGVGASLLTQSHVFYQDLSEAMRDAARNAGYDIRIQYCERDGNEQNTQLHTFALQHMDAIILSPYDSKGVSAAIRAADDAGIPVFTVDIAAENAPVVAHIASDNVEGGRILGEYLAEHLGGEGRVAIIDFPAVTSVQERVRGFEQALAEYPGMEIVAKLDGQGERDQAFRASQDLLQSHPDLDGIFGINDDSALAALAAVEAADREDEVVIVGYDGTPEARQAILEGSALIADTVQYPKKMGRIAIETVTDYLAGQDVPEVVPVPVGIIDKETLEAEQP